MGSDNKLDSGNALRKDWIPLLLLKLGVGTYRLHRSAQSPVF